MSGNRTPAGFYGATGARKGRRLVTTIPAKLTASEAVQSPRYSRPQTYQPNETLFERRDYQLDLNLYSDAEDQDDLDRDCGRQTLSDASSPLPTVMDDPADMYTPRSHAQRLNSSSSSPLAPPSIVAMLQEQQGMMKKLLTEQQEMRKLMEQNRNRVKALEESFTKLSEQADSSTGSSGEKRPRTVTRDLTVSIISQF